MYRIAIVGRPNVGKSTLFNRLSRTRRALVGNEPGITRDRIFQEVSLHGKHFELIDTGGIVPDENETIPAQVLMQAETAIESADAVLLVVDARQGLTPLDEEVAQLLQSRGQDFWVVANKVDVESVRDEIYEFTRLGAEEIFPVSAEHNRGIEDLLERLLQEIPDEVAEDVTVDAIKVAIIGRPNVGKSSLLNRMVGRERVIVTDIPGTTRDSVDTFLRYGEQLYQIIDTAGIRRKGRTEQRAEKLSVVMARKHMKQADVVLLVIDSVEGATKLDAAIGGYAHEEGRSIILVVNKWDLISKDTQTARTFELEFRRRMKFLDFAPMLFVSALSGQRVLKLLEVAAMAHEASRLRVPTAELNKYLLDEVGPALLRRDSERKFPLKYVCQVGTAPPTFALFLRGSEKLHFSTVRFLTNRLRERYVFFASPIRLLQRPQKKFSRKSLG